MIIWIDAQLSPALAPWLSETFGVEAFSARRLGFVQASDQEIFLAARAASAIVITKDSDFVQWLERLGPPPQVVWITCGNTSNARMRELLSDTFQKALNLLEGGEALVEISDA